MFIILWAKKKWQIKFVLTNLTNYNQYCTLNQTFYKLEIENWNY